MSRIESRFVKVEGCFDNQLVEVQVELDNDETHIMAVWFGPYKVGHELLQPWVIERAIEAVDDDLAAEAAEKAA